MTERQRTPDGAEMPTLPRRLSLETAGPTIRFLGAFALALALCAGTVAGFNYVVDPRAEFTTGVVIPLVDNAAAKRIALLDTFDRPPKTVVLGDSKVIRLGEDELAPLAEGPVLNLAIPGGPFQDLPVIYRYLVEETGPPDQIVVGVSLRQAHGQVSDDLRQTRATADHVPDGAGEPLAVELASTLTSSYVNDSATALWYAIDERPQPTKWYADDGTRQIRALHQDIADGTLDGEARIDQREVEHYGSRMEQRGGPSDGNLRALTTLVREATAHGTTVRLVAPPVHPSVARNLSDTSYAENHGELMDAVRGLCREDVHVHDLSDWETLKPYGGRLDRFFDPIHTFGENGKAIGRALADPSLDECPSSGGTVG